MDYTTLIAKYYNEDADLRRILIVHSEQVARRALRIAHLHPELSLDETFLYEAAMLHDIGIVRCDAPGICCHGAEPYIRHGIIGAAMLREEGYERHARVCERHTGAGLPLDEIKSHLDREKTVEQAAQSLAKFGEAGVKRFLSWSRMFE